MTGEVSRLEAAISSLHVRFGTQALARGGSVPAPQPWPTGVALIDRLSGLGGLPQGRLAVLEGSGTCGKLSLGLAVLGEATRTFAQAVVLDPGGRFDPWALLPFAPRLEALTVVRPPHPGAAAEAAIALAKAGAPFLLVFGWDGGGAAPHWLGTLETAAHRAGTVALWTTATTPSPLAHASSLTLRLQRREWVWEHGQLVGLRSDVRAVKNKVSQVAGLVGDSLAAVLEIRYPLGAELFPSPSLAESAAETEQWQARSAAG